MKSFFKVIFLFSLFTTLITCSDQGTNPPTEKPKDPREMIWTADTLAYPESIQTLMSNILAFNSKDIFIYGHNFITKGKTYHFDGIKWEVYDLTQYIGGYNVLKMIAFSRNNIWGAGDRGDVTGLLFNFNGSTWTEYKLASYYPPLYSIDGETANEFYACGRDGIVWYNKNGNWLLDTVKIKRPVDTHYQLGSLAVYNGEVFMLGWVYSSKSGFRWSKDYLIRGKYQSFTVVDSMDAYKNNVAERWGIGKLIKGNNGKLYSRGSRGFYEWDGTNWKNFHQSFYGWGLYVYNDNYMMDLGTGGADFYNGQSWIRLDEIFKNYRNVTFMDAWTNGKELFIIGNTSDAFPQKTIILHGK
jgi:hypothetical protein